jgi:23S rRNA U2552 (ribose-2'-O)-methylase RlmE/FtsJ
MYLVDLTGITELPLFDITFSQNLFNDPALGDSSIIDSTKNKIGQIDQDIWSRFRKYSNIYEQPKIKNYTKNKPISRAYYKLWEILHDFNIECDSSTFHIAESPGGFIEAVLEYKKRKYLRVSPAQLYYTVSLQGEGATCNCNCGGTSNLCTEELTILRDIPKYNKRILRNKSVKILVNEQCNGDICDIKNILYLYSTLKSETIKFITADGGMNDNGDYNNKEISHIRLIICEVFLALLTLEDDGVFVLKIFDILTKPTSDIILLLTYLFNSVTIFKPLTSRNTNSEKYLVCRGFKKGSFTIKIKNNIFKIVCGLENSLLKSIFTYLPVDFVALIRDTNCKFMNQQKISIEKTLDFIQRFKKKKENGGNRSSILKSKYSDVVIYDFEIKKEDLIRKWLSKYQLTVR